MNQYYRYSNNIKIFSFIFQLILSFILSLITIYIYQIFIKEKEIKFEKLRIGIISDSQIDPDDKSRDIYIENLKMSLETLKKQNLDILIVAGDFVNKCSRKAFLLWKEIYNSIFPNEKKPIFLGILGNHDYYIETINQTYYNNTYVQNLFYEIFKMKEKDHLKIKGYDFILWGNQNGNYIYSNNNTNWVINEIEKANKIIKYKKPIFIITHFNPSNTVYTSWGDNNIFNSFKHYKNIINLSGHSHYSLIDERSIFQNNFLTIQTQSISNIELEKNFENGNIPKDEFNDIKIADKNPMGLIIDIEENGCIEFKRIFLRNNQFYHIKWNIKFPLNDNFNFYNNQRKELFQKSKFYFKDNNINVIKIIIQNEERFQIKFNQAINENVVYGYKIILENNKNEIFEYKYFSDFYLIPEERKDYIILLLNKKIIKGKYKIIIEAFDSFNNKSQNSIKNTIYLH